MRSGFTGEPLRWYISQPAKSGPLTVHFCRLPSEERMKAPLRVPTRTRTLLMGYSFGLLAQVAVVRRMGSAEMDNHVPRIRTFLGSPVWWGEASAEPVLSARQRPRPPDLGHHPLMVVRVARMSSFAQRKNVLSRSERRQTVALSTHLASPRQQGS